MLCSGEHRRRWGDRGFLPSYQCESSPRPSAVTFTTQPVLGSFSQCKPGGRSVLQSPELLPHWIPFIESGKWLWFLELVLSKTDFVVEQWSILPRVRNTEGLIHPWITTATEYTPISQLNVLKHIYQCKQC